MAGPSPLGRLPPRFGGPRPQHPPPCPPAAAALGPVDDLLWWGAGLVAGCGLVVWAGAQLAARIHSGAWLEVGAAQMAGVLLRLPSHLSDPAAAWPAPAAAQLPGPIGFWAAFLTLVALPFAALLGVVRYRHRDDPRGEVRWAAARDLRPLLVRRPTLGRLTLGRWGRRLVAVERRHSLLVLGPTQSLKTSALATPAILEWAGPMVATSVKTDLLDHTLAARSRLGEVFVYDPTATSPYPTATWDPLAACTTWHDAQVTADWLTQAGREELREGDFWYATAATLLAPLLYAAARSGRSMGDVVRWVQTQDEDEVRFELRAGGVPEALQAAEASWKREARTRSSVYTTAEMVLRAFTDPQVAASTAGCDITGRRLLDGGAPSLFVCAPTDEQARLRPLFTALIAHLLRAARTRAATSPQGRLDPPLLVVLDEAANIAPLPDLDTLASTAAGLGIQLVTVFQDLGQIRARYGVRTATVVNNHRAKLALSGLADDETLRYLPLLVGDSEQGRSSITIDPHGRVSTTDATTTQPLASAAEIRQIPPGHGLLVYGHLPPARLRLRPWWKDRRLRRCAVSVARSANG